ncbi:hypothetical protein ACFXGT_18230 [Streptomyces sp. NPDC059352]|uniref:hypothetical protein n=1 Tax=Streptomyces sp. NPDC059352 TaxID=3346810 RepID=UPI0036BCD50A
MNPQTRRWLLAPARQWRTYRLMRQHGTSLDYGIAWALIALRDAPGEFDFVQLAAREAGDAERGGLHHDDWNLLTSIERDRRSRWFTRHGKSPIERLGLSDDLLARAGLRVVDWGRPGD